MFLIWDKTASISTTLTRRQAPSITGEKYLQILSRALSALGISISIKRSSFIPSQTTTTTPLSQGFQHWVAAQKYGGNIANKHISCTFFFLLQAATEGLMFALFDTKWMIAAERGLCHQRNELWCRSLPFRPIGR
mmetsp:Transcript_37541/g.60271  ORF Transcript_37541/g.60271 Transcript_37541/m.60271 type:complete len:135 (+) Transcript_37541:909-1313(+)